MKNSFKLFFLLIFNLGIWLGAAAVQAGDLPVLKRGVNLSHWLQYGGRQPIVAADMDMIRRAGFDHVRIPFDPIQLGWNPDALPPTDQPNLDFTRLDRAVDLALQADLALILDFHPQDSVRNRIETETGAQHAFLDFWGRLAERYAHHPISRVVFELLNEPQYYQDDGATRWDQLQRQTLAQIRLYVPEHLVLLAGIHGGSIEGLQYLSPVADAQVRYVFHFYEPALFTHLNAPWEPFLSGPQGMITGLPYPARDAINQVSLLANANPAIAWAAINQYIRERWGPARIQRIFARAAAWAAQRGMTLVCTEFGALRHGPDALARRRWLYDTRSALENSAIGWTVWDYADLFGVATATGLITVTEDYAIVPVDAENPQRQFDSTALRALGLTGG